MAHINFTFLPECLSKLGVNNSFGIEMDFFSCVLFHRLV